MGYVEDLRKRVGKMPVILVGSVIILLNKENHILLQERKHPNKVWGLPGGLMERGESTEETVKRELTEETGLQVNNLQLLSVYSGKDYYTVAANGDPFYTVTTAYYSHDYHGVIKVDEEEAYSLAYFALNDLPKKLVGSHHKMILDYIALQVNESAK